MRKVHQKKNRKRKNRLSHHQKMHQQQKKQRQKQRQKINHKKRRRNKPNRHQNLKEEFHQMIRQSLPQSIFMKSIENININQDKNMIYYDFKIKDDYFSHITLNGIFNQEFYGILQISFIDLVTNDKYFTYDYNTSNSIYASIHQFGLSIENNFYLNPSSCIRLFDDSVLNDFHFLLPQYDLSRKPQHEKYHVIRMILHFKPNLNKNTDTNRSDFYPSTMVLSNPDINADFFKSFDFKLLKLKIDVYENQKVLFNDSKPLTINVYHNTYKSPLKVNQSTIFDIQKYNDNDYWSQFNQNESIIQLNRTKTFVQNVTSGEKLIFFP